MCGFSNWTRTQVTMMWDQANRFSGSSTAQSWRCSFFLWGGKTRCTRWQKIKILYQQNVGLYWPKSTKTNLQMSLNLDDFGYEIVMSNSIWLDGLTFQRSSCWFSTEFVGFPTHNNSQPSMSACNGPVEKLVTELQQSRKMHMVEHLQVQIARCYTSGH